MHVQNVGPSWGILWRLLLSMLPCNVLTMSTVTKLHNWCQLLQAIPVTAPGGGPPGFGLDASPNVNPLGIPEDMLAGSPDQAGVRAEPAMNVCNTP